MLYWNKIINDLAKILTWFCSKCFQVTNVLCVRLLSHDRYQSDSLILSKQTWAYPRQHLQQLLWCVVSVRLNLRKPCPLCYYANCVSTTLTVLILHNVESVYFFYSNCIKSSYPIAYNTIQYPNMGQPSTQMAPIHNFNFLQKLIQTVLNYVCNYSFSNDELRKKLSYGTLRRNTNIQHIWF